MQQAEPLRPLTQEELELFQWMFDHGSEELRTFMPQMDGMLAARWCDCGCSSIRLEVAETAPRGLNSRERVIGDFAGKTANGALVGVLLFQRDGRLELLEIYSIDGLVEGEFGLPTLDSLKMLEWEPSPHHPNVWIRKTEGSGAEAQNCNRRSFAPLKKAAPLRMTPHTLG